MPPLLKLCMNVTLWSEMHVNTSSRTSTKTAHVVDEHASNDPRVFVSAMYGAALLRPCCQA